MKRYIEGALFEYPSIFSDRFSVLSHLFATLGNGEALDEAGYLTHPHPEDLEDLGEFLKRDCIASAKQLEGMYIRMGEPIPDPLEGFPEKLKEAMSYRERYLKLPPKCLKLYSWSNTEKFQPFRKYQGCQNEGFLEEVKYFCDTIRDAEECSYDVYAEETGLHQYFGAGAEREHPRYLKALQNWKENINIMKEFYGV